MKIPKLLAGLELTPDNSVVIGSGILNALGLRTSNDIDVVVTEATFKRLEHIPRFSKQDSHGRTILTDKLFEIGTCWGVLGKNQAFDDLLKQSTVIAGVRYVTPAFLLAAKRSWLKDAGRPKDFADVKLLEDYLASASSGRQQPDQSDQARFVSAVLQNPKAQAVLQLMPELGLKEWYFTAGGVFQTVWNVELGRDPQAGIKDYDVFYFDDADLSYEAEDSVIQRGRRLFADVDADIELRNEARVHLWYEEKFGVPAKPFAGCEDAINHFASTTCCYGLTIKPDGSLHVYAPHGYDDLFNMVLRPNPVLAPRDVYEAKAKRWTKEWPSLAVEPWPDAK